MGDKWDKIFSHSNSWNNKLCKRDRKFFSGLRLKNNKKVKIFSLSSISFIR